MTTGGRGPRAQRAGVQVVVMAKYPVPGRVKTRLAGAMGATAAAELYRAFVLDLAERLAAAALDPLWAVWPAGAPFEEVLPGASVLAQDGRDLGGRMSRVAQRLFSQGKRGVVFLGADVPHVDLEAVRQAVGSLDHGRDEVVLGPADDGGYYLLGLRRLIPQLFRDIEWGGPHVCASTKARLRQLGVRYGLLAYGFDVDEPADLARLADLMERGTIALPHTAAALARLS